MTGYSIEVFQCLLSLMLAPGLVGMVRWFKARLQNRRGAPPGRSPRNGTMYSRTVRGSG